MKTKQENKKQRKNSKGITLIALVITIIVLLILAGVSIAMLTGQNGILTQAQNAKNETEKASLIEQVQLDILGEQTNGNGSAIQAGTLQTILNKYFSNVPKNADDISVDNTILKANENYGGYEIPLSDIYNGEIEIESEPEKELISTTESYVGYYADIDGIEGVDGIIYADLAVGNTGSGQWYDGSGNYEIPKVESGLRDYYIKSDSYEGDFGTKPVIAATGTGGTTDRFYVMALEDIDNSTHYWYYNAYRNMDDYSKATSKDFGTGKANTSTMILKWNSGENGGYGAKNDNDMWGLIQNKVAKGWFVPSRAEWSAFAEELKITKDNYDDYGLSGWYWSSSQGGTYSAYSAGFNYGYIYNNNVASYNYVRLSATF